MTKENKPVTAEDIKLLHDTFMLGGDPNAPYWLLGLENIDHPKGKDRKSPSVDEVDSFVQRLLAKNQKFINSETMDFRDCEDGTEHMPSLQTLKHDPGFQAKYQRTWGGYAKLILAIEQVRGPNSRSTGPTIDEAIRYQGHHLGSLAYQQDAVAGSCLMDLFPLARQRSKSWFYHLLADRAGLQYLNSVESYEQQVIVNRITQLRTLLLNHQPDYLLCFGKQCHDAMLAQFTSSEKYGLQQLDIYGEDGSVPFTTNIILLNKTHIVFCPHPVSRGVSNRFWCNLGQALAQLPDSIHLAKAA